MPNDALPRKLAAIFYADLVKVTGLGEAAERLRQTAE